MPVGPYPPISLPAAADSVTITDMEITTPAVEDYLMHITPQEDPILGEMETRARERPFPIVGPLVGRILYQLVRLTGSRRILEFGSGFGYSAYWFGRASPVQFYQGDALETLKDLEGPFDIIFNDVDKHQYPEAFKKSNSLLAPGGLFISDNVLWQGQVVELEGHDENTRAILEHNRLVFENPEFFSSIIPVRDEISLSVKK